MKEVVRAKSQFLTRPGANIRVIERERLIRLVLWDEVDVMGDHFGTRQVGAHHIIV